MHPAVQLLLQKISQKFIYRFMGKQTDGQTNQVKIHKQKALNIMYEVIIWMYIKV